MSFITTAVRPQCAPPIMGRTRARRRRPPHVFEPPVRIAGPSPQPADRLHRRPHPPGLGRTPPLPARRTGGVHVRRGLLRQGRQGDRGRPRRHRRTAAVGGRRRGLVAAPGDGQVRHRRAASSSSATGRSAGAFPAVVAGMVMLGLVYPLARRLGLPPPWALIALGLAAADPLGIAQSRIATLDVFVAVWSCCASTSACATSRTGASAGCWCSAPSPGAWPWAPSGPAASRCSSWA